MNTELFFVRPNYKETLNVSSFMFIFLLFYAFWIF